MPLHPDYVEELRRRLSGEIRVDSAARVLYSTDASMYQLKPTGVVLPRAQEDLHAAVELSAKYDVPILPRGSGTSLAGQAIGNALIIDCSRWLHEIVEINPDEHIAVVEPGVVLAHLNRAAAKYGLQYGPDPASADRATMGGVIANNATGAHSILYGMSADHIVSADVVLADGSLETWDGSGTSNIMPAVEAIRQKHAEAIERNFPRTWRNSAGYRLNYLLPWSASAPSQWIGGHYPPGPERGTWNLAPLLAGSEGTLAVIRRARVNLVPKPKHTILAVLAYESVAEACDDVPRLLTHRPSAIELIPRFIIRQARSVPAYARQMGWVVGDPAALLVVEFSGDQPSALKEAARGLGGVLTIAESREDQDRVWNVRRVGLGLLDSRPGSARPVAFIEDCAIPVERLGDFVRDVESILAAHGTEGGMYAHASAGCLHIRPILDLKTGRGVGDLRAISEAVFALTLSLGGAMSSEHGDGLARSEYLERTYGPELMDAMRALKRAADPHNILNPGKIIDAPKLDAHLRYGAGYGSNVWDSGLSFAREGGLALAVEQCNGQGLCRKDSGVMCPSYQATREEMHSTRGRANLLRALISHPPAARAADLQDSVFSALELCLACKGCKAECPSGVDMAKLKFAFEAEFYRTHRRPLRDYVFGYFHITAALAASVAPVSNALMRNAAVRKLVAGALRITPNRPFPKFLSPVRKTRFTRDETPGRRLIYVPDPFGRYIEPATERAALAILARSGYEVHVLAVLGSGAMLLSKGLVNPARRHAWRVLDAIAQADPSHTAPIVGLEPPEIYTLKHDYVDLLPERADEVGGLAERVWLLDEFLLRSVEFQNLRVAILELEAVKASADSLPRKIRFLPHCHQRAEGPAADGLPTGAGATVELLRQCGYDVELLDTGCCGMAGSFGYEAEHYDLSMKVGELKLFPALRATSPKSAAIDLPSESSGFGAGSEWAIVSTGAACRMQILQGTGLEPHHSVVMVANALMAD